MKNFFRVSALALFAALALAAGCRRAQPHGWQGYFEGEFVYVGSPLPGRLDHLAVTRGSRVDAGAALFTLEHAAETAAQQEAEHRLQESRARLADLQKGVRPSELATYEARLAQAQAAAELSDLELKRVTKLYETQVVTENDFDRARLTHATNLKQVAEASSQIDTARLGARSDNIAAAQADVAAAQAALDRAEWNVAQKTQAAPRAALVDDTLYREGEFVVAGAPIIALLPPENLKVRFFVPEAEFGGLKAGDPVQISFTGRATPIAARVSYLSPRPEYTPPVLYNRENRAKLVFMVEAVPVNPAEARDLHPGQPVDVTR
ncbi:MAG TPA: HlyD family efflux transporter periplasmic adaptor subunit [Candidatus Didemnitutus sp.]|nr:HlyD family efflux transporter periplasmic adaptor subunit [Candidatus Didemnitutus sp.]